jgi:hypothetical protein
VCGKRIAELEEGNTIFRSQHPANTLHVHKECDAARRASAGKDYDNWHPLDHDVIYLMRRYGFLDAGGELTKKCRAAWAHCMVFDGL